MQANVLRPEEAIRRVMPLPPARRAQALRVLLQGHPHELARALDMLPTAGAPPASMLEAKAPAVSPVRVGAYALRSVLGEGGFGVVWMATQDQPLERSVALKILRPDRLDPTSRARFDAERRLLALLDHPSLVKVFEAGETPDGRPWFSMELVAGAPVTEAADAARLGLDDRLRIVAQVARAVHHAHERGLVHRDLKPANILLSVEGDQLSVKVIDFGVAHATLSPADPDEKAGALVGTPDYLAPELLRLRTAAPDVRSDIFALGVILRRLLVGGDPGDRREGAVSALGGLDADLQRTVATERRETVTSLRRRLEGDLEAILARCLADDPRDRYATALEFAQDLDRHLAGDAVVARGDSLAYRGLVVARQNRRAISVATLIALVASIGIGWAMHERNLALIARDEAEDNARRLHQANAFVFDLLTEIASAPGVRPRTAADMLAEASRLAGMRLSGDRVQEARVRYAIGRLFAHLQQHGRASQEFDRVAVLTGDRPALPDLDALPLEHAAALRAAGRLDEAARLAETAVTSAQAQVPEDHDDLATTLLERARIALKQGDAVGARARALEARRALTLAPAERADLALAIDELLDEIARRPPPTR